MGAGGPGGCSTELGVGGPGGGTNVGVGGPGVATGVKPGIVGGATGVGWFGYVGVCTIKENNDWTDYC